MRHRFLKAFGHKKRVFAAALCVSAVVFIVTMGVKQASSVQTSGGVQNPQPAPASTASAYVPTAAEIEAWRNALSTSSEGLVVEPSPVPGGGFMVDLQGRFMVGSSITVTAQGDRRLQCGAQVPVVAAEKAHVEPRTSRPPEGK